MITRVKELLGFQSERQPETVGRLVTSQSAAAPAAPIAPVARVEAATVPAPIPAPQITDETLDQIAARVVVRLGAGVFGEQFKNAVNDAVRSIVSDTSERLVREEIDRIRNQQ